MSRAAARETAPAAPRDDMFDSPEEMLPSGSLRAYQEACNGELLKKYRRADREAMRWRNEYRMITAMAGGFGSGALLMASLRVAFLDVREAPLAIALEFLGVLFALVVVITGLILDRHGQWLLFRYQSERFRLLKFRLLGRPELWTRSGAAPGWQDALRDGILEVEDLTRGSLEHAAQNEPIPEALEPQECARVDAATRERLLEYYRSKRLGFQMAYFEDVKNRIERRWSANARLLPLVFVASLSFVILHLLCDALQSVLGASPQTMERWCAILVLVSFAIPGVWAGFRTWRTANEFGRNLSRSVANLSTLSQIARRLENPGDPLALFGGIALCEYALALDQDEWLRLMLEAEWFG